MSTPTLPSPRHLLSALITSLPQPDNPTLPEDSPPTLPPALRPSLLTLHTLYPSALLPALDLLDRGHVTRLRLSSERHNSVYYIHPTHPRPNAANTDYEVRLRAWNCTCPAFAWACFAGPGPSLGPTPFTTPRSHTAMGQMNVEEDDPGIFGGLAREVDPPVCKHLLACVLVEWGGGVFEEKCFDMGVVGREELAGRGAGR